MVEGHPPRAGPWQENSGRAADSLRFGSPNSSRSAPGVYNRWENGSAAPRLDTLVKIADILGVTLDELVGRSEPTSEVVVENPRLHELYRQIARLSDEDQQALVILLDSLVKRSQMGQILAT